MTKTVKVIMVQVVKPNGEVLLQHAAGDEQHAVLLSAKLRAEYRRYTIRTVTKAF